MPGRRRPHPFQPALWRTSIDVPALVEEVRSLYFPRVPGPVPVFFAAHRPLACAVTASEELVFPAVYIHQVLNHPETPVEVLRFIAKHELLHLAIPPKRSGRRVQTHPREFWDAEARIAPESRLAWQWITENLGPCLARSSRAREVHITRTWTALEFAPRAPWAPITPIRPVPAPLL
ncbi:MAG: hypothetical protein IT303_03395 [Dehalococcoidia bacterium]|nr:hypothetical protein [Dehalococcoidia bacterium]